MGVPISIFSKFPWLTKFYIFIYSYTYVFILHIQWYSHRLVPYLNGFRAASLIHISVHFQRVTATALGDILVDDHVDVTGPVTAFIRADVAEDIQVIKAGSPAFLVRHFLHHVVAGPLCGHGAVGHVKGILEQQ